MAWGTLYAFLFPFLSMLGFGIPIADAAVSSAAIALFGGPGFSAIYLFLVPFTRRFPFFAAVLIQISSMLALGLSGFYVAVVIIGSRRSGMSMLDPRTLSESWRFLWGPDLRGPYLVALGLLVVMTTLGQLSSKLGPGVLGSWMTGKYHRPKEETRIFMFLDVKDSTPLAERLGNLKFSELIQWFFRDLGECLGSYGGAVSHYIGDEAVIHWTPKRGLKNANCVRFFFDLERTIAMRAERYRERFGVVPAFKAGLHIGQVVVAEVGSGKTEIVLHGDAVNTTARIVGKCAEVGTDLLLSRQLGDALGSQANRFRLATLGTFELKGKAEKVELLSAEPE